ncbi:probable exported protease [[Actinomadura] parvosata subsp. kistnae]|uniref:Alpha/beta hydrolase n=1 Tax=[Actinomadura] parvosata subsp. kistnae TaxID=1909395 RepID=A0A1V0AI89_9ACTN|nr:alpha/beta hydrolase [Nonomuraea sp. ATCC 55076]AQZ69944.1 alpha/beta hydrolase [Nonomuraea sp. ATCC 55076]SPL90270.1 probable exported protease [Actinomadura parvosata subsp. kistnae]
MRRVTAAALLLAAATGCSAVPAEPASGPSADSTAASDKISWGACTDIKRPDGEPPARQDASIRCGKLTVPLDYAQPDGEKLELALIKLPATGKGKPLGSMVFNFGGPGASGVDTLDQAAKALTALRARYDLVSFDPRGVERSSGVRCGSGAEMDTFVALDTLPPDDETDKQVAAANKRFAALCQQNSGKILPHVGTVNAARDMDRIRDAVGDPKLNYVGMSYGTQLGAVYATLFPKNVGRMVLDAPLDPTVTFEQRTLAQTRGFQQAYESFLRKCVKETCALGKDEATAHTNVENLLNQLTAQPIKVGNRQLTQGLASTGVAAALYSELTWPFLEEALGAALKGDGEALLYLADSYTGRSPDGSYSTQMTSFPAITCVDTAERPDEATLRRTEAAALKISPLFGSEGSGGLCRVWPAKGSDEARHVNATGSAPIVVVGGKGDPATPYEWAPKLTAQLKTATLVTYEGEGHGAYLSGSKCIQGLVDAYLIDGKVPAKGATCPAA